MSKTRLDQFHKAETAFLLAEKSAAIATRDSANCVATMIEVHATAKLRPEEGAEAFAMIAEAAHYASLAREKMITAHNLLAAVPANRGILNFGPDKGDEPNSPLYAPFFGAELPAGQVTVG